MTGETVRRLARMPLLIAAYTVVRAYGT